MATPNWKIWKVTGTRALGAGATAEILSTAFGRDEDAAWRSFDQLQNQPTFSAELDRRKWDRSELTFEPIPQHPSHSSP